MHSAIAIVLLSVVQLWINLPVTAGDCWDDPHANNKSYDNCATCYQTLANAVINTEDNKFQLGRGFSPDDAVTPIEVRVEYIPESQCYMSNYTCKKESDSLNNDSTRWYWLAAEFYIYQPVHLLLYRSLFFSPPVWRHDCVVLCLPDNCLRDIKDSYNFEKFFLFLTQRVSSIFSDSMLLLV